MRGNKIPHLYKAMNILDTHVTGVEIEIDAGKAARRLREFDAYFNCFD